VGMAFHLGLDRPNLRSHRSQARSWPRAVRISGSTTRPDGDHEGYFDGDCLRVVEKDGQGSVKDLAMTS